MRQLIWTVLGVICLALFLGAGNVFAQALDRDRVKQEIEQTDQVIEQARKAVEESRDQRAEAVLQVAEQAQARALQFLETGRLNLALQFTLKAREAARRCIGMMVRSGEDRSVVEQQLDRTDELIEQIGSQFQGNTSSFLDLRLQEAQRLQDRARDLFSENNLRQSLQFTRRAQDICRNLMERTGGGERQREHLRQNLDRALELVSESRDDIEGCGNQNAVTIFEAGAEQVDKAEQLYQAGNYDESVRLLASGLVRIHRAKNMCGGQTNSDDVARALETAQMQLEQLLETAQDQGNRDADKLLDEAAEKLDQARKLQEQGDAQRALVVARVVIELNQQAAKILGAW
ncbi:MAG: hypothetical protein WBP42_03665 [Candidatus Zixiibacteriota bacterium]